ncbi:MAG TPA: hypothetical protein PLN21_17265 [Gemmatales bacterium]|nr:hypothetical protein [Gemmatales bacterium]
MKALNSFALISLSSLAVAGVVQADEPIKTQPQQQPASQTTAPQQAQTPQYQLVQSGRRQRWQLVQASQSTIPQPSSSQQTTPTPAAQSSPTTATSPARITAVPQQQYVIEERKPGLLSRLRAKRYQYSSASSVTPVTAAAPSAASQPLPNAK